MDDHLNLLAARVPYLICRTDTDGPGWISGDSFLGRVDDDPLDTLLAVDRTDRFAHDLPAYASALFEGYAIRLLGTSLGLWLLGGRLPDPSPSATWFRLSVDLPFEVAFTGEGGLSLDDFVDAAVAGHLDPLAERITDRVRIGHRLLWSNMSSAVSTTGLAVAAAVAEDGVGDPTRTIERFRDALPERVSHLGHWVPGPQWFRGACCLWFREDPDRSACTLCPITHRRALS